MVVVRFPKVFVKKKLFTMSGVSRDAPIGIQCLQRISQKCCPQMQINRLRWYQGLVLVLTYLTYMTYHLTRKPISVVKSVLHRNCSELTPPPGTPPNDENWCDWPPFNTSDANTLLGAMDSAFLFSYAAAMFVSGMIAERVDLRYFLSLGMLTSAFFCYLFGLGRTYGIHSIPYYLFVQAGAGIAQTTGWPGTVAIVGKWFGNAKKGLIFGIWNSHTSLGNILGTLMASAYVERDWAYCFVWPAAVMGGVACLVQLLLPPGPDCVGAWRGQKPSRESRSDDEEETSSQVVVGDQNEDVEATEHTSLISRHNSSANLTDSQAISLTRALAIPGVIEFSFSLFFAKLVSYTFLYWLPVYIGTSAHLTPKQAGTLSTVFDVGGMFGAVAAGLLADKAECPALVCVAFYTVCAPMLFVYEAYGASSFWLNCGLLIATGALVNGPYALITTAVSAELGTHSSLAGNAQALATVTAIIDGTGSVGAAIGPMLAGVVSSNGDWSRVFLMLITCNFLALLLLVRIAKCEIVKLRQDRRLSPRVIRIE